MLIKKKKQRHCYIPRVFGATKNFKNIILHILFPPPQKKKKGKSKMVGKGRDLNLVRRILASGRQLLFSSEGNDVGKWPIYCEQYIDPPTQLYTNPATLYFSCDHQQQHDINPPYCKSAYIWKKDAHLF